MELIIDFSLPQRASMDVGENKEQLWTPGCRDRKLEKVLDEV